jgi:hypothetical protein
MPKKPPATVPVNRRALIARVDRALAKQGRELRIARRGGMSNFLVIHEDAIADHEVDLEVLARKVGAMEPWEKLANS